MVPFLVYHLVWDYFSLAFRKMCWINSGNLQINAMKGKLCWCPYTCPGFLLVLRWEVALVKRPLTKLVISALDMASQTPSDPTTMNSQQESSLKVWIWGTTLITCFQAGLSCSDLSKKSPKLLVGMRTPPTLQKDKLYSTELALGI